jgi:2-polyprenyl-3-methyl-5-hydroxy-6-metoxy-1,4-benzoquinol methylase
VEVLEHVAADDEFVRHVYRVLKPNGCFLMSTPNGDFVKNTNPDHQRHYTRAQLGALLERHFTNVEVTYAIRGGRWRRLGLNSWSPRRPLRTTLSIIGNLINSWQSARPALRGQPHGTHHLIALARK